MKLIKCLFTIAVGFKIICNYQFLTFMFLVRSSLLHVVVHGVRARSISSEEGTPLLFKNQENPKTGDVSIPGATQVQLMDQMSFVRLLHVGEANRFATNTIGKVNMESSSSHALLLVSNEPQ